MKTEVCTWLVCVRGGGCIRRGGRVGCCGMPVGTAVDKGMYVVVMFPLFQRGGPSESTVLGLWRGTGSVLWLV
jgi:hypothetical protein